MGTNCEVCISSAPHACCDFVHLNVPIVIDIGYNQPSAKFCHSLCPGFC